MHPSGLPPPPAGGSYLPDTGHTDLPETGGCRYGDVAWARRVAVEAAEAAGELVRAGARCGADPGTRAKGPSGDVVTELDLAAEQLIVERIQTAFPGQQIIAEEAGVLGAEGTWTWLVDPLDGTNNLAVGLPAYVVGIALCRDRVPVLGVVHDPLAEQTWWAVRGEGAYGPHTSPADRRTHHTGGTHQLRHPRPGGQHRAGGPLLAWTQGHHVARDDSTAWAMKIALESVARRMLQLWTPLTSWLMLARGDIDGFVGYQAEAVDLPAGALIAAESGISLCGLDGTPFDDRIGLPPADRSFIAARAEDVAGLTALVRGTEGLVPVVKEIWSALPGWDGADIRDT